ncbi:MAG: hypothetical protein ACRDOO_28525 [Actinomadura sp.]
MSDQIQHRTTAIRNIGTKYEGQCGDTLKEARYVLNGRPREAQSTAFTMYGYELAMAHTLATEWADEDLKTKAEQLADFKERLHVTAQCWDDVENANTLNG